VLPGTCAWIGTGDAAATAASSAGIAQRDTTTFTFGPSVAERAAGRRRAIPIISYLLGRHGTGLAGRAADDPYESLNAAPGPGRSAAAAHDSGPRGDADLADPAVVVRWHGRRRRDGR
jgi:hypothetical protein